MASRDKQVYYAKLAEQADCDEMTDRLKSVGKLGDELSDEETVQKYEVEYSVESLVGSWRDEKAKASSYEVSVGDDSKVTIRTRRPHGEIIVTTGVSVK